MVERLGDRHEQAVIGGLRHRVPRRGVPHLAAERIEVVRIEEQLALGGAFADRHRSPRHLAAPRVVLHLLHQPRGLAVGARRRRAVPPPANRPAQAIELHLVVRAAGRGGSLPHPPGVFVGAAVLAAGEGEGRLRAVRAQLEAGPPEAIVLVLGDQAVRVRIARQYPQARIEFDERGVLGRVDVLVRKDALRLVEDRGLAVMAEGVVRRDAVDVAEVVAPEHHVELGLGAAVVGLDRLGVDLAVDRRRSRELPALRHQRRGAALLLRLELAEHPSVRVVLEGALDPEREVDPAGRDLLGAHVAELVEVRDARRRVAQDRRAGALLGLPHVRLEPGAARRKHALRPAKAAPRGQREVRLAVIGRDRLRRDVQEGELDLVGVGLPRKAGAVAPFVLDLLREREHAERRVEGDVVVEVRRAGARVEVDDDALSEAEEAVAALVVAPVAVADLEAPHAVRAVVQGIAADDTARARPHTGADRRSRSMRRRGRDRAGSRALDRLRRCRS